MTKYKRRLIYTMSIGSLILQMISLFVFIHSSISFGLAIWASFLSWFPIGIPVLLSWERKY